MATAPDVSSYEKLSEISVVEAIFQLHRNFARIHEVRSSKGVAVIQQVPVVG